LAPRSITPFIGMDWGGGWETQGKNFGERATREKKNEKNQSEISLKRGVRTGNGGKQNTRNMYTPLGHSNNIEWERFSPSLIEKDNPIKKKTVFVIKTSRKGEKGPEI